MLRFIFKIIIPIVLIILCYNYFFGSKVEKENSQEVFSKVKDISVSVFDLLKNEKEKFDEGKYQKAVIKIQEMLNMLNNQSENLSDHSKSELLELEKEKKIIEKELEILKKSKDKEVENRSEIMEARLLNLLERSNKIMNAEIENK